MTTNIGYWERVLQNPTPAYKELLNTEKSYLKTYVQKDSFVLDVGCGDGTTIKSIQEITTKTVGIDNDPQAVEDAKEKLVSSPDTEIIFVDALDLPFDDKLFDVVTHMMTLVNFKDEKVAALREMNRVLKDDGKIIISVYSEDALPLRLEMYKQIGVPIEKIDGTTIIFDKSVGANESEQFSKEDLNTLAHEASLKIENIKKIGSIAYILTLSKV